MATTINASTGVLDSTGGVVITGDTSGVLALQTDYVTLVTLSNGTVAVSGNITATGNIASSGSLSGDSATISGPLAVTGETSFSADATFSSNGAIKLPAGTTAQQPGTPINGMLRYNTEDTRFEGYANDAWGAIGGGGGASSITSAKLYFFAGI